MTSIVQSPIVAVLGNRRPTRRVVGSQMRRLRHDWHKERADRLVLRASYADGLPAEREASLAVRKVGKQRLYAAKSGIRAAYLSRVGRRIDLMALLALSTADGKPAWTVADPAVTDHGGYIHYMRESGKLESNLTWQRDACPGAISGQSVVVNGSVTLFTPHCRGIRSVGNVGPILVPTGMPPLPPEVRRLATDPKISKRAAWIGVLYQPVAWEILAPNPDPALVVEWKDRPGEFYALAIWGHDGPRIMEFVD